jgi:hypothetical protein
MYKSKFLFFIFLSFFASAVLADCYQQTQLSLQHHTEDRAACIADKSDPINYPKCMLNAVIRFTESSCLPSQRASGKVLQILWQDFDKLWSGKNLRMTLEEFDQEIHKRSQLIKDEERLGVRRMNDELDAIQNSKMRSVKDASLNNLIDALGGIVNRNSSDIFTYTYRGITTTCTTNGSIVNCN